MLAVALAAPLAATGIGVAGVDAVAAALPVGCATNGATNGATVTCRFNVPSQAATPFVVPVGVRSLSFLLQARAET